MPLPRPLVSSLILTLLLLAPGLALANDAEYGSYSGTPMPIKNDSVRMVSENIIFTESDKGTWRVDATYVFENTTAEKVELKMGYPEAKGDDAGLNFKGIKTWVDGKQVKLEEGQSGEMKESPSLKKLRLGKVFLFDVAFAPSQTLEVKHTFEMDGGGSVALACEKEISYITRTGKLWKGPIGKARFEVNLIGAFDAYTVSDGYDVESITHEVIRKGDRSRTKVVFEMEKWTPKSDFNFVMMSECGEEAGMDRFYTGVDCPFWTASELVEARIKTPTSKLSAEQVIERREAEQKHLSKYSKADLRLCRNYVYARYGYPFKSKDLQKKFYGRKPGEKHTYPPHYCSNPKQPQEYCREANVIFFTEDKSFTPNLMTPYELIYVKLLLEEEKRRKAKKK